MKIAIIHEWLTAIAGSEKVLEQILDIFPEAHLFVIYADPKTVEKTGFLAGKQIRQSFIAKLPLAKTHYRKYLPLMPLAIEQFDLSGYDLIISSSHAVSKGVLTGPDQLHISYVHSPIRYAWDLQHQYLNESGLTKGVKSALARYFLHNIRIWDYRTAAGVDHFIANSKFISRRINKVYRRNSTVIYPPVDTDAFSIGREKEEFYLTASRMVPYKRVDLVVEAFSRMPDKQLVVVGDGPEMSKIRALAKGNVQILGFQDFPRMLDLMRKAKAFVFAAEEDFGITPVEAQACGTPVIAFGKGGSLETVIDASCGEAGGTGVFFYEQSVQSLIGAVEKFQGMAEYFSPDACRKHAEKFSTSRFKLEFAEFVEEKLREFHQR